MKIEEKKIKIGDIYDGYLNEGENGVVGYHGRLNIRPSYQREFVYDTAQRDLVLDTILKGFPLSIMYWMKNGENEDGEPLYDLLDGQQRTISFCEYLDGKYEYDGLLACASPIRMEQIKNYEITIYICEGNDEERIKWFERINIAGKQLTKQEIRNSTYSGTWCNDAKKNFSRSGCRVGKTFGDYLKGDWIRQDWLETALSWIADRDGLIDDKSGLDKIEKYMSAHKDDENANDLIQYFNAVVKWVKNVFHTYRPTMKGLPWGVYYNKYKDVAYIAEDVEEEVAKLMDDDEVQNKKAIYEYVLSGHTPITANRLNFRCFDQKTINRVYKKQGGICPACGKSFALKDMEADHIIPWSKGGKTVEENCQMLCQSCNSSKGAKALPIPIASDKEAE